MIIRSLLQTHHLTFSIFGGGYLKSFADAYLTSSIFDRGHLKPFADTVGTTMPSSLGKRGREDSVSSNSTGDFALARGLARRQLMIARLSISEPNPEEGGRPGRFPRPNTVKQPSLYA